MQTSTLKPGLLVSLKTSLKGNVSYQVTDIEPESLLEDGSTRSQWDTIKTIADKAELERAKQTRSRAVHLVKRVCAVTAFGLICPESKADKLDQAITEARSMIDAFNQDARITRLGFYVIAGRIAADDVEAVRAINSEIRDLLSAMESGVKNLNADAIRAAANKAQNIAQTLTPEAKSRVESAISSARRVARQIVKRGEEAARYIDQNALRRIAEQRVSFLELGDEIQVASPTFEGATLDLGESL